jgi:hypothetical protein
MDARLFTLSPRKDTVGFVVCSSCLAVSCCSCCDGVIMLLLLRCWLLVVVVALVGWWMFKLGLFGPAETWYLWHHYHLQQYILCCVLCCVMCIVCIVWVCGCVLINCVLGVG